VRDETYWDEWAQAAASLKSLAPAAVEEQRAAGRSAYEQVYRAVAFDIDGTLTPEGDRAVDAAMAAHVTNLLAHGVPVFLITGRGREGARSAGRELLQAAGYDALPSDVRRQRLQLLRAVTHNGAYLLETENPQEFLGKESLLVEIAVPVAEWIDELRLALEGAEGLNEAGYQLIEEPHSARISFATEPQRSVAVGVLQTWVATRADLALKVTVGRYDDQYMVDVGFTDKGTAVVACAEMLDVHEQAILRIGDQGAEGGNDFDLLNARSGFSVNKVSAMAGRCHPILDRSHRPLEGVVATSELLSRVHLFGRMSFIPRDLEGHRKRLIGFERLARRHAHAERTNISRQLAVRLRALLAHDVEGRDVLEHVDELFDARSGGVRLRDWELESLRQMPGASAAFHLDILDALRYDGQQPATRALYTDTGVLLRGAEYYASLVGPRTREGVRLLFRGAVSLCADGQTLVDELRAFARSSEPEVHHVKALLGLMDQVRNAMLQTLNVLALLREAPGSVQGGEEEQALVSFAEDVGVPHTTAHVGFLLDSGVAWEVVLERYAEILITAQHGFESLTALLDRALITDNEGRTEYFKSLDEGENWVKWREADHVIENLVAVQVGLRRLVSPAPDEEILAVGLAYGGIELPLLAAVLGQRMGRPLTPALLRVSVYGNVEMGETVRAAEAGYAEEVLQQQLPLNGLTRTAAGTLETGKRVLVLDDNCTTAVTMQLARDVLTFRGADVIGAVVVRYPGANRFQHMALDRHGFLDLRLAFSFLWGFVAPSPYSRLVTPNPDVEHLYKDASGVFDKAKERIRTLLVKNDPSALGGSGVE
jgi:adenine/guanine phosphoribosyltransferase-like PRPP-binding protein